MSTASLPPLGRPLLISFSGMDGAGKSTQIENLLCVLQQAGLRTQRLAFWDDVVVGTRWREGFVHRVYQSQRGIGAPGRPVERRDKNVRRWYLTLARHALYFLDALNLARVVRRARGSGADVIVVDRYIYDELGNLPLAKPFSRSFALLLHALVPRPDIAYLLDADPEAARARKPEYPVEFLRECRKSYLDLARLLGTLTVIPPLPLEDAKRAVEDALYLALATGSPQEARLGPAAAA